MYRGRFLLETEGAGLSYRPPRISHCVNSVDQPRGIQDVAKRTHSNSENDALDISNWAFVCGGSGFPHSNAIAAW